MPFGSHFQLPILLYEHHLNRTWHLLEVEKKLRRYNLLSKTITVTIITTVMFFAYPSLIDVFPTAIANLRFLKREAMHHRVLEDVGTGLILFRD